MWNLLKGEKEMFNKPEWAAILIHNIVNSISDLDLTQSNEILDLSKAKAEWWLKVYVEQKESDVTIAKRKIMSTIIELIEAVKVENDKPVEEK